MRKLAALAGAAALGLGAQTAFGYAGTATLTFTFGGSAANAGADQGFVTSAAAQTLPVTNSTLFSSLAGANSTSSYNSNFATPADCAPGAGIVPVGMVSATRKYGCRYGTTTPTLFAGIPLADTGPVGMATGVLNVTDTTMTGTLTILATSDEPTGATTTFFSGATGTTRVSNSVGDGFAGYNYRTADGSPFGSAWYGVTTAGILTVNLTGTFTDQSWTIDGGAVTFTDAGFACQQGGFGGDSRGTLCSASATGGGFQPNGAHLSWGMDVDGGGTGTSIATAIDVRDAVSGAALTTLSGVLANITLDGLGNITGGGGEFRRGAGSAGTCPTHVRYNTSTGQLTCGSITSGYLSITGTVVPVPAAVWLLGSALGLLGWMRRKATA